MKKRDRQRIAIFFRKPRNGENYSIERLFNAILPELPEEKFEIIRYVCPFESKGLLRRLFNILWATSKQADINHVTGDVNFIGILMRRSRTVLTIHDSASMVRLKGFRRWIYWLVWLKIPIWRANRVTVISDAILQETSGYVPEGREKYRVIPNCITGTLKPNMRSFNAYCPRILQIGTKANKNLSRVIESIADLSCVLVIIGVLSDMDKNKLNQFHIQYENYVNLADDEIAEQYRLSDIVLFASLYEGFGLPILEAQAVGRPVVTSIRAPMNEVAGSGALLVNPEDTRSIRAAIQKIIQDETCRCGLVTKGFDNIQKYSEDAIAAQYASVYHELG